MKHLLFLLFTFFFLVDAPGQQNRLTGLILDDEAYRKLSHVSANIQIDPGRKSLIGQVDLTPFCPEIRNQGDMASCVGWSVGYGAMTIERAVLSSWKDQKVISENAHSALFIYNQIRKGDCRGGITIPDALSLLREKGNCLAADFDFSIEDCTEAVPETLLKKAAQFKIEDFIPLFQPEATADEKIKHARLVLSQNKPVIVGMEILRNFINIKQGESRWMPGIGDKIYAGTHAMVAVGYDDHKFRGADADLQGAFKLMNSWGKEWGEDGFIWVRYADFARYCRHAFAIKLADGAPIHLESTDSPAKDPIAENKPVSPENQVLQYLSGAFGFRHHTGGWDQSVDPAVPLFEDARVQWKNGYYTLEGEWKPGDRFQLQVKSGFDNGYIYVLSVDPSGTAEVHFPRSQDYHPQFQGLNESALMMAGGSILTIPALPRTFILEETGTDYLIVLFSTNRIGPEDIQHLCRELPRNTAGLKDALGQLLGKDLVPPGDIAYRRNEMGFEVDTRSKGRIVPILLEINVSE